MNIIKNISLIFENCEVYTIPLFSKFDDTIQCAIEMTGHQMEVRQMDLTCFIEIEYFDYTHITIIKNAHYEVNTSYENSKTLFERILSCQDIIKIVFEFEDKTEKGYYVPWDNHNDEYNRYQESSLDTDGNLVITIGDHNE